MTAGRQQPERQPRETGDAAAAGAPLPRPASHHELCQARRRRVMAAARQGFCLRDFVPDDLCTGAIEAHHIAYPVLRPFSMLCSPPDQQ